jgi:hypothetical protein
MNRPGVVRGFPDLSLLGMLPNMRMHLQKPRAPWSKAGRRRHASFQVIRGR